MMSAFSSFFFRARVARRDDCSAGPLRGCWLICVLVVAVAGCEEQEEWSPLDGPWDPEHPDAPAILAAPYPGSPVDREMSDAGQRWYRNRGCLACHSLDDGDVAGPGLGGVTRRRDYDWFRGMVMRPDSMLLVDPIAQGLLRIYRVSMPDQGMDELRTRAVWEYLRMRDDSTMSERR